MQMMEHVHLAGEDEADDDIYSGFNEYDATLDTEVSHIEFIHSIVSHSSCGSVCNSVL